MDRRSQPERSSAATEGRKFAPEQRSESKDTRYVISITFVRKRDPMMASNRHIHIATPRVFAYLMGSCLCFLIPSEIPIERIPNIPTPMKTYPNMVSRSFIYIIKIRINLSFA